LGCRPQGDTPRGASRLRLLRQASAGFGWCRLQGVRCRLQGVQAAGPQGCRAAARLPPRPQHLTHRREPGLLLRHLVRARG
jgi:hypothetical protein